MSAAEMSKAIDFAHVQGCTLARDFGATHPGGRRAWERAQIRWWAKWQAGAHGWAQDEARRLVVRGIRVLARGGMTPAQMRQIDCSTLAYIGVAADPGWNS